MEVVSYENLGVVSANTWATSTYTAAGPGTFVFVISANIADIYSLFVQVEEDTGTEGLFIIIEDATVGPGDRTGISAHAGYQSVPVPLFDTLWKAKVRVKHDDPATVGITVRVIKL